LAVLPEPLASEILTAPHVASLATLNEDGTAHLVAVWFDWDGEALLVPTSGASRKARNLGRDPRATVMVHDSRGGLDVRGLSIVCRGEVIRGPAALAANDRAHLRYVTRQGLDLAAVAAFLGEGDDVTLRLLPERVTSWDETDTPAARALRASGEFVPPLPGG
jgi:PPOX class probable F420-dependent enzyme